MPKVGDEIRYVENYGYSFLTKGKTYEVKNVDNVGFTVTTDEEFDFHDDILCAWEKEVTSLSDDTSYRFLFSSNYNADMQRHIDDLYMAAKTLLTSRQERLQASDDLVEAYVSYTDKRPDGTALGRLATLILRDEAIDPDVHKVAHTEYPFHSARQARRREEEATPYAIAQDVATDGRDYRIKTRDSNRKMREINGDYR